MLHPHEIIYPDPPPLPPIPKHAEPEERGRPPPPEEMEPTEPTPMPEDLDLIETVLQIREAIGVLVKAVPLADADLQTIAALYEPWAKAGEDRRRTSTDNAPP